MCTDPVVGRQQIKSMLFHRIRSEFIKDPQIPIRTCSDHIDGGPWTVGAGKAVLHNPEIRFGWRCEGNLHIFGTL